MSHPTTGALSAELVADRLAEVRRRVAACGADTGAVEVVAVTKGHGVEAVTAALGAGLHAIGENYAEELVAKAADPSTVAARWHFLGAVQRRKVARLAKVVSCWQTVCRLVEGESIAERAPGAAVLVEVNLTGRPERNGVSLAEVPGLVGGLRALVLDVVGVMAIGVPGPPEDARPGFRRLAELARDLGLEQVSMGMSDDLEVAVQEGSTMIRIGRGLFGSRPTTAS